MAKSLAVALLLLVIALPTLATAGPDCVCRADGRFFHQGELFCLRTPQGERLARCEMSQNVTTWRVVEQGCPTVEFTPLIRLPRILVSTLATDPSVPGSRN